MQTPARLGGRSDRRIGRQMRYAEWLQAREETFRDRDAEVPPEVAKAVRRFER